MRLGVLSLAVVLLGPVVCAAAATPPPKLVVEPQAGHGDDLMLLSGTGYRAHTKLTFLIGCPNAQPGGSDHVALGRPGPVTDAHGRFTAFPLRAPALPGSTSMTCHLYASQNRQPFGPADPPTYTLYADGQALPSCATQICLHVTQKFARYKVGYAYTVTISGWPGMTVQAWIQDERGVNTVGFHAPFARSGKAVWRLTKGTACQLINRPLHIDANLGFYSGSYVGSLVPQCS